MSVLQGVRTVANAAPKLVSTTVLDINVDFGFTPAELNAADTCTISTTQLLSIMYDGVTVPSPTVGLFIGAGGAVSITPGNNVRRLTMVRGGGSDCNVTLILEGY